MTVPRVALVGLQTSHPADFAGVLRDLGSPATVVHEPGDRPGPAAVAEFAAAHGIDLVATDENELVAASDLALLLGTDWDARFELAGRLLDRGVAVLLDKPIAGRAGDLRTLASLAAGGDAIGGGSSLRYAPEATGWRAGHPGLTPSTVLAGSAGHPFYYGVHAVAMALAVLGDGVLAARAVPGGDGIRGQLRHATGSIIAVDVRPARPGFPFYATVITDRGVDHLTADPGGLYRPYLSTVLGDLAAGRPPLPGWIEPELAVLALALSAAGTGDWVELTAVPDDWAPWSGADFAAGYRTPGEAAG